MRKLDNELKNRKINVNKLLEYGFIREKEDYIYRTKIHSGQFEMIVEAKDSGITSRLIDLENKDEYILVDIQDSIGEFVGKLREEYENELKNIIEKCTVPNVFKSEQSKEIIKYIKEKYNDDLEFLWKKFPKNAIWRNNANKKWYGALLVLQKRKLKIDSEEIIDIIDLRYQKERIKDIIDNDKVFPGYHMNKNSWITIKLDNSVETERIFELIDNSYNLSLNL